MLTELKNTWSHTNDVPALISQKKTLSCRPLSASFHRTTFPRICCRLWMFTLIKTLDLLLLKVLRGFKQKWRLQQFCVKQLRLPWRSCSFIVYRLRSINQWQWIHSSAELILSSKGLFTPLRETQDQNFLDEWTVRYTHDVFPWKRKPNQPSKKVILLVASSLCSNNL